MLGLNYINEVDIANGFGFNGKDENISSTKSCANCYERESVLQRCSNCLLVKYCNVACQREHHIHHKIECKAVSIARKKVEKLEIAMRGGPIPSWDDNTYLDLYSRRINFFSDEYLGNWWGHLDPRDYCRAVWKLSESIKSIAWDYEQEKVWKQCIDLKLELLRNNVGDNQGIRSEVPAALLYLNDDDGCFKFIKWWAYNYLYEYASGYKNDNDLRKLWKKGEFVYNEVEGDRFDDVYPMYDDDGEEILGVDGEAFGVLVDHKHIGTGNRRKANIELSHLIALVVIKMRVCVKLEYQLHITLKENPSADTTAIRTNVEQQKKLLDKYLKMTHKSNNYILYIFAEEQNIRFMREQGPPQYYSLNSPEEAYPMMDLYTRHIARSRGLTYCKTFLQGIGQIISPNLSYRQL